MDPQGVTASAPGTEIQSPPGRVELLRVVDTMVQQPEMPTFCWSKLKQNPMFPIHCPLCRQDMYSIPHEMSVFLSSQFLVSAGEIHFKITIFACWIPLNQTKSDEITIFLGEIPWFLHFQLPSRWPPLSAPSHGAEFQQMRQLSPGFQLWGNDRYFWRKINEQ